MQCKSRDGITITTTVRQSQKQLNMIVFISFLLISDTQVELKQEKNVVSTFLIFFFFYFSNKTS